MADSQEAYRPTPKGAPLTKHDSAWDLFLARFLALFPSVPQAIAFFWGAWVGTGCGLLAPKTGATFVGIFLIIVALPLAEFGRQRGYVWSNEGDYWPMGLIIFWSVAAFFTTLFTVVIY